MNILPAQLIGKTVKDCYQGRDGYVVMEFTDGTKIRVYHDERRTATKGHEVSIRTIII